MKFPFNTISPKNINLKRAIFFSIFSVPIMVWIFILYLKQYVTAIEDIQKHKFIFYNGIKPFMWIFAMFVYMPVHSLLLYLGKEHCKIPVYILAIITGVIWAFWDVMPMMTMQDAQIHSFWLIFDMFAAGVFWVWLSFFLFYKGFDSYRIFNSPISWIIVSTFFVITNILLFYLFYVYNRDKESNKSWIVQFGDYIFSLIGIHSFSLKRVNNPIHLGFLENNKALI